MDNKVIEVLFDKLHTMGLITDEEYKGLLEKLCSENKENSV